MMERLYGITFEIDGNKIRLEQDNDCGEVSTATAVFIHDQCYGIWAVWRRAWREYE